MYNLSSEYHGIGSFFEKAIFIWTVFHKRRCLESPLKFCQIAEFQICQFPPVQLLIWKSWRLFICVVGCLLFLLVTVLMLLWPLKMLSYPTLLQWGDRQYRWYKWHRKYKNTESTAYFCDPGSESATYATLVTFYLFWELSYFSLRTGEFSMNFLVEALGTRQQAAAVLGGNKAPIKLISK